MNDHLSTDLLVDYVHGELAPADDARAHAHLAACAACREALQAAYAEFEQKSPIETRLFKVLRDRDPSRPATRGAFVPLSDLVG